MSLAPAAGHPGRADLVTSFQASKLNERLIDARRACVRRHLIVIEVAH
jgi:hypothetical protein